MGLKIFNVNSYSSFSRSNSIIYCSYLSCPHFLFHFQQLIHSYLWFFHFFHSYLILILSVPVVSWLNLFSNLFLTFMNLFLNHKRITSWLIGNTINTLSSSSWLRLVFWKSIHLEVASGPFCLLVNSPWLLVFALCIFFLSLSGFNLYCWRGIHFSWSNSLIFLFLASEALLFISFFWASFHSLSSPTLGIWPGEGFYLPDPCELTFSNTLLLSNAAVSLGVAFISLQIKEFRIMGLSINDSVYSSLFFFLTGLHFFHLLVGLFLCCLFFWGCSFPVKNQYFLGLRVSEVHLFYNLQLFYWHFLEILWLFIFLVFYRL